MKYDDNLYQWTKEQADALRRRAVNKLDYGNLAEEIESVGRGERPEIRSRLEILLIHLLKCRYLPEWQSPSWEASIEEARRRIEDVLGDNPSLRSYPAEALAGAYRLAVLDRAIRSLDLGRLPRVCPCAIEDVLSEEFLPE
jgi:hypothetical protein